MAGKKSEVKWSDIKRQLQSLEGNGHGGWSRGSSSSPWRTVPSWPRACWGPARANPCSSRISIGSIVPSTRAVASPNSDWLMAASRSANTRPRPATRPGAWS